MTKSGLLLLFIAAFTFLLADGIQPVGEGDEADPYQIESLENLLWMGTNQEAMDKYYIQTADIDALETVNWNDGAGFIPIGHQGTDWTFYGHYDGQGHTVSNLYINRPEEYDIGLFGFAEGAFISNLNLEDFQITGEENVGGLGGFFHIMEISNCYCSGTVTAISNSAGGIAGTLW
jgi:hypothetical protein